jgi:hypothetical protein
MKFQRREVPAYVILVMQLAPNGDERPMSDEELLSIDGVEKQTRKYGDAFIKAIIESKTKVVKKKERRANLPRNVRNV